VPNDERRVETRPPELGAAVVTDDGEIELRRFVQRMVKRQVTETMPTYSDRASKPQKRTEMVAITEQAATSFHPSALVVRRVDGTAVIGKALFSALTNVAPVVIVKEAEDVDSFFLELFRPETLIVSVKSVSRVSRPSHKAPSVEPSPRRNAR